MEAFNVSSVSFYLRHEVISYRRGDSLEERIASLYEFLRSRYPGLAKNFLTFVTFLKHIAPDRVESFLESMESLFDAERKRSSKASLDSLKSLSLKLDLTIGMFEKVGESGEVISAQLSLRLTINYQRGADPVKEVDPLVLDMKGDGIKLSGLRNPAYFDIDGDGKMERVSFVEGDDAFLFLDFNMNRFLDGGWELVGDGWGFKNGFEMLKAFDLNGDGRITPKDRVYSSLYIFQDLNGDKKVQASEVRSIAEAGILEINLFYTSLSLKLNSTDKLIALSSYKSSMRKEEYQIGDVLLSYI